MLREQLEYYWSSYVLPVVTLVFLVALTFASLTLVDYGERAAGQSARMSNPPSDFLVYIESEPRQIWPQHLLRTRTSNSSTWMLGGQRKQYLPPVPSR